LIEAQAASLFGAVVTISMATTPFLLILARRFEHAGLDSSPLPDGPEHAPSARAVVVGFGRFGQTVSQMLMGHGVSVTLVDVKPAQIEVSGTYGAKVYYGDGRRVDLLRKAGADEAQLILFCLDDRDFGPRELEPIATSFPRAALFVRAFDRRQIIAIDAFKPGITTREVFESAVRMGIDALEAIGATPDDIAGVESDFRDRDARRLAAQIDSGDLHALQEIYYRPGGTS
jgi:glutathione-regulated potassium-efflux system protein KefB